MSIKSYIWSLIDKFLFCKKIIRLRNKNNLFLLETPIHENIGDSAIAYAEQFFLNDILNDDTTCIELNQCICKKYRTIIVKLIQKNDIILLHGGGNMGIEWFEEEQSRRFWIEQLTNNKIIVFPQTIFYPDTFEGNLELQNSRKIYNQHKKLVLNSREKESFKIMNFNYQAKIFLTADIVLYLKNKITLKQSERKDCLLCFRNDAEKNIDKEVYDLVEHYLNELGMKYIYTDMISSDIIIQNRESIILSKLNEFKKAELVITDRLHAMVFCYLTKTPCLVFKNYNHKVDGTYDWIRECNYINLVDKDNLSKNIIEKTMNAKKEDGNMDYMLLFEQLKNEILQSLK